MVEQLNEPEPLSNKTPAQRSLVTKSLDVGTAAKITTVTGETSIIGLTICDAHNHVWIDRIAGSVENAPILADQEGILQELIEYKNAGGNALTDCQPGGCGRNGTRLQDLALASEVKIIACTGFHRSIYYPENFWMWKADAGEILEYFVSEICMGLAEARGSYKPPRAGFVKIACEARSHMTPQPALEAAAQAVVETGMAIQVHTEKGADAERIITFLEMHNVRPGRIVLCHMDKRPDFSLHAELAQEGILLEYDTFFRPKYTPEENLWPLIEKMVAAGLYEHVALATDMAEKALWAQLGAGPGLASFPNNIRTRLRKAGLDQVFIDRMMGINILRRLAL